jgi:flagellin
MTRINTNVSSLVAQKTLARSNEQLQTALTRLSTGLRINVGKDDPAGLIASEVLRSDIISVNRAISNSERANQIIATADSALGQVSSLLNDIRGLVSEAANTGALSDEQIAANQLQVDSSLEAIDRIAQTTSFQGRRLLDGSLDFLTSSAGNADVKASGTFGVDDSLATVTLTGNAASAGAVSFTALSAGTAANGYAISYEYSSTAAAAAFDSSAKTLRITVNSASTAASVTAAVAANASAAAVFSAAVVTSGVIFSGTTAFTASTAGGAINNKIVLSASVGGAAYNNATLTFSDTAATGAETASYSTSSNTLTVFLKAGASSTSQVLTAINATGVFSATTTGAGQGIYTAGSNSNVTTGGATGSSAISDLKIEQANFGTSSSIPVSVQIDAQAKQGALTYSGGALTADLILEIGGESGFETFNFGSGTSISQIATALNTVSDATGVQASVDGTNLQLKSTEYGSDAFVSAKALSGTFGTVDSTNTSATRNNGADVRARINGVTATGDGLRASLNTSTLDLNFVVNKQYQDGDSFSFNVNGGGATFQIGPDVVSNQQARIGIQGVSTATLGGVSGKLFEIRSGGSKNLASDVKGAAKVVDEVISTVTGLRGRLGAFQRTTLESNIVTLGSTLENLTAAESSIRDADFAAESANLTRAQILVQSGTAVLQISNSQPQNVLGLLRG